MTKPTHAPTVGFPVRDGLLHVGAIPLDRLVHRVGRTPFYAYDRGLIANRVQMLKKNFPPDLHIHYAIKANPMPAVVHHVAGLVDGLDVASAREMQVALNTTAHPSEISFAGPGKSRDELSCAVAAGIVINLESESELEFVAELADRLSITPLVAVRVNPDFELRASGMKMGGGPRQFGVDVEQVPRMLQRIAALGVDFRGLHIFAGSQNLREEAIIEAQEKTFELAARLADDSPLTVRTLNIGGGLGIPYFPGDTSLDLAPIGENLYRLMDQLRRRLPDTRAITELGRYLVGEAGIYVCRVIHRKISCGQVFLITDGGLHHHLAASGNFGQVIRKNYPVVVGNKMNSVEIETASVVGPLCTPLDLLAEKMELAKAEEGDLIVVFQSGAYGLTASPTAFLSHPPPMEVLV